MKIEEFKEEIKALLPRIKALLPVQDKIPTKEKNTLLYLSQVMEIATTICELTGNDIPQAQEFLILANNLLTGWERKYKKQLGGGKSIKI